MLPGWLVSSIDWQDGATQIRHARLAETAMVAVLPPNLSTTFLAALVVPLVLGFLVGILAKALFKVGVTIAVIVIVLMVVGAITPGQLVGPVVSLFRSGESYASKVSQIAGYLPYSSVTFILGLVVGFFKG